VAVAQRGRRAAWDDEAFLLIKADRFSSIMKSLRNSAGYRKREVGKAHLRRLKEIVTPVVIFTAH